MSYVYSQLDDDCIRLLAVHCGQHGSPLSCSLSHSGLGDLQRTENRVFCWSTGNFVEPIPDAPHSQWVPEYDALSYTWGDQLGVQSPSIDIDGCEVKVSRNLYAALQMLRRPDTDRILWIDAVCIDQNNLQEKSRQIEMMRTIYLRSRSVNIWLGEEIDDSEIAMDLLERLGGYESQITSPDNPYGPDKQGLVFDEWLENKDVLRERDEKYWDFIEFLRVKNRATMDTRHIVALEKLLNRRWWSRVWVIQEVTFAKNVWIHCGARKVRWDALTNLVRGTLETASGKGSSLFHIIKGSPADLLVKQRIFNRNGWRQFGFEGEPLLEVLDRFRGFQSTDPRDKVYALLALASSSKNVALPQPDYHKTVAEIFTELVRDLIEQEGDLYFLHFVWPSHAHHKDDKSSCFLGLPSWVPDWTVTADRDVLQYFIPGVSSQQKLEGPDAPTSDVHVKNRKRGVMVKSLTEKRVDNSERTSIRLHQVKAAAPSRSIEGDPKMLRINGIPFDVVSEVSSGPMTRCALDSEEWISTIKGWEPHDLHVDSVQADRFVYTRPLIAFWMTLLLGSVYMPKDPSPEAGAEAFEMYDDLYMILTGRKKEKDVKIPLLIRETGSDCDKAALEAFATQIKRRLMKGSKFCVTERGYMGIVPEHTTPGDEVCVLFGLDAPALLRVRDRKKFEFSVVGVSFIFGVMSGEIIDEFKKGNVDKRTISIV